MDKFSKKLKDDKKKVSTLDKKVIFKDDNININEYIDTNVISGSDYVICLPIIEFSGQIVMAQKEIKSYEKRDNKGIYLNLISTGIRENESRDDALRRELQEFGGIFINSNFAFNWENDLYAFSGSDIKYNICLISLYQDDYYQGVPIDKENTSNKCIYINRYDIDNLIASDVITELMLIKAKQYLNG